VTVPSVTRAHIMTNHNHAPLPPTGTRLLDALSAVSYHRMAGALSAVALRVPDVLSVPGQPIEAVYFPLNGVVSLVTPLEDGAIVEVATIGNEGIVGVPLVLGGGAATVRAITQVGGRALRMDATAFVEEVQRRGDLNSLVQN